MTSRISPAPTDVPEIREAVRRSIADAGLRPTARAIGMSQTGLNLFATGASAVPYSPTLRRLRKWYQKHASTESEG